MIDEGNDCVVEAHIPGLRDDLVRVRLTLGKRDHKTRSCMPVQFL
jgi:hypothetical protein